MNKLIKFIAFEAAMLAGLYVLKNYTEKYMKLMEEDEKDCGECGDCCCTTEEVKTEEKAEAPANKNEEVKVQITPEIPVAPVAEEKPKRVAKPRAKKAATTAEAKPVKRVAKPRAKKADDKKEGE